MVLMSLFIRDRLSCVNIKIPVCHRVLPFQLWGLNAVSGLLANEIDVQLLPRDAPI
jgi:hypothetical protein